MSERVDCLAGGGKVKREVSLPLETVTVYSEQKGGLAEGGGVKTGG